MDLLAELGESDRELLMDFVEARSVPAGEPVFRVGDASSELLVVLEGGVRLESGDQGGGVLAPGEIFGAMSLVRVGARVCSAYAEEDTRLLVLSRESYARMRAAHPTLALVLQEGIVRSVAGDLRIILQSQGG